MKAILLIHGFVTDPSDFERIIPDLKTRYDCVHPVVIPGHGPAKDFKQFNAKNTFQHLLQEYDNLHKTYDTIDVMGFSLGGALATYLQTMRPIHKLILLAPANKYFRLGFLIQKTDFWLDQTIAMNKVRTNDLNRYQELKKKIQAVNDNTKISAEMALKVLLPSYTIRNLNTFVQVVKQCNESFTSIAAPTLIVWGKLDQLVPYASVEHVYAMCTDPRSKLVILDDMSHLMFNSVDITRLSQVLLSYVDDEF